MYRKQVRRRRAVLVASRRRLPVLISISLQRGEDGPLHGVSTASLGPLPLEEGASRALKPARDLVNWFDETLKARGENDAAQGAGRRAAVASSLRPAVRRREGGSKTTSSRKLVERSGALAGYKPVDATSSAARPTLWYEPGHDRRGRRRRGRAATTR